jgi:hypothetical protein
MNLDLIIYIIIVFLIFIQVRNFLFYNFWIEAFSKQAKQDIRNATPEQIDKDPDSIIRFYEKWNFYNAILNPRHWNKWTSSQWIAYQKKSSLPMRGDNQDWKPLRIATRDLKRKEKRMITIEGCSTESSELLRTFSNKLPIEVKEIFFSITNGEILIFLDGEYVNSLSLNEGYCRITLDKE